MNTQIYVEELFNSYKDDKTIMQYCKNIDAVNEKGETTLHKAILARDINLISRLIKHGAKCNVVSKEGKTPLLLAVETDDKLIVDPFTGGNMFSSKFPTFQQIKNSRPKIISNNSKKENTKSTDILTHDFRGMLIDRSSNKNNTSSCFGITPLHMAVMLKSSLSLEILLNNKIQINVTDINGDTALMYAAYMQNITILQKLLKHGANPSIKNKKGQKAKDHCLDPNSIIVQKLNTSETFALIILAHKNDKNCYLYKDNIVTDIFKCITRLLWRFFIKF